MKMVKEKYIKLDIVEKQKYIKLIKDTFERELAKLLKLTRVSAPIFVTSASGLQDDLTGVERTVKFDILKDGQELEIVQSLAKWKRMALKKYSFVHDEGLYTDMMAIRRDDKVDQTHSIYVDQWDWEKIVLKEERTLEYLKRVVSLIVLAIHKTSLKVKRSSGKRLPSIKKDCFFITTEELLQMYPDYSDKEREDAIVRKHKTVFIMQIGDKLSDGKPHDLRAPDYDDWSLNGDLLFYDEVLDGALELSSMGIRVDSKSLVDQLTKQGKLERLKYEYHKSIQEDKLPLTIGGGIGQSRLCMLLLGSAHIGEVQSSYWDKETVQECARLGVELL